jgi:hypothetical protein
VRLLEFLAQSLAESADAAPSSRSPHGSWESRPATAPWVCGARLGEARRFRNAACVLFCHTHRHPRKSGWSECVRSQRRWSVSTLATHLTHRAMRASVQRLSPSLSVSFCLTRCIRRFQHLTRFSHCCGGCYKVDGPFCRSQSVRTAGNGSLGNSGRTRFARPVGVPA